MLAFDHHKTSSPYPYLSLINNQLMLALGKADVFGGMGSWNDIGLFDDPKGHEMYQRLSDELYQVINEAIISAINHDKLEVK